MKTQKQHLTFRKNTLVELNNSEMLSIDGGTTPLCAAAAASSGGCAAGVAAAAAVVVALVEPANDAGVAVGEAISRAVD